MIEIGKIFVTSYVATSQYAYIVKGSLSSCLVPLCTEFKETAEDRLLENTKMDSFDVLLVLVQGLIPETVKK